MPLSEEERRERRNESKRRYYQRHRERVLATQRQVRRLAAKEENPNRVLRRVKLSPEELRERKKAREHRRRERLGPEQYREMRNRTMRRYYGRHREKLLSKRKDYYVQHQGEVRQRVKEWKARNPERVRELNKKSLSRDPLRGMRNSARHTFSNRVGRGVAMPVDYLDAYVAMLRVKRAIKTARNGR